MKYYILFNPLACSGKCEGFVKTIELPSDAEKEFFAMSGRESYCDIIERISGEDKIVICGGDGTLNRFVNSVEGLNFNNEIFYMPAGSGNDFLKDIGNSNPNFPIKVNEYFKNLPLVYIEDKAYRFINGIGYGVDGYCCKEVNRLKSQLKKASYTLIAIKALLFGYKPTSATVTVDGKEYRYNKVWLAPTMKGKYFGGGMMIAPNQNRNDKENLLTVVVAHNLSKLKIVSLFPTIFKGTHIKYKKYVDVHTGKNISVKFDIPSALQVDGETVLGVKEYSVNANIETEVVTSVLS